MARVLVVVGAGVMRCVLAIVIRRSGRRLLGVRMLCVRVGHRGRSGAMPRLAMLMWNTRGGQDGFPAIVMRRTLRLVSM